MSFAAPVIGSSRFDRSSTWLRQLCRWTHSPGDLIFGDLDGVVVIPRSVEDEVVELALKKAAGEKVVRKAIEAGMTSTEAFRKYGIL